MDEKKEELINLLLRLPRVIRNSVDKDLFKPLLHSIDKDLAPQHLVVLKHISEEGIMNMNQIGEPSVISKAQMTQIVDKLAAMGMLERRAYPKDRRKIDVVLTEQGKKTVAVADELLNRRLEEKLSILNRDEIGKMIDSLKYVLSSLEKL
jgi:DNA-binding MarR family transcriptional regulator